jgi:hypothetical protein
VAVAIARGLTVGQLQRGFVDESASRHGLSGSARLSRHVKSAGSPRQSSRANLTSRIPTGPATKSMLFEKGSLFRTLCPRRAPSTHNADPTRQYGVSSLRSDWGREPARLHARFRPLTGACVRAHSGIERIRNADCTTPSLEGLTSEAGAACGWYRERRVRFAGGEARLWLATGRMRLKPCCGSRFVVWSPACGEAV